MSRRFNPLTNFVRHKAIKIAYQERIEHKVSDFHTNVNVCGAAGVPVSQLLGFDCQVDKFVGKEMYFAAERFLKINTHLDT